MRGCLHGRLKARATRPPLPSRLLADVCSIVNKMDELRKRITTHTACDIIECCFTETWLTEDIPDSAIYLKTHAIYRADRT